MTPPRVVLVDGTGLVFRAFFALPQTLTTTQGLPTNAAFGFAQMFRKIFGARTPTFGAVVFDAGGGTFRHELDLAYKAQRPSMPAALRRQLDPIDRLVAAHGFPVLRIPGVEADDVIATLWKQALDAGMEVTIVSGDKDFAQLVIDDRVRLYDSTQDVHYDGDRIRRKFGVLPGQFTDYQALVGDTIDNIPGVPGIGDTTAAALLQRYGDLEGILAASDLKPAVAKRMARHGERARLSKRLATLRTDVPLPHPLESLTIPEPQLESLNAVYQELEFFSLLSAEAPGPTAPPLQYFVCDTAEMALAALGNECCSGEAVGVHVVHEFAHPRQITGIAVCPGPRRAMYIPFRGEGPLVDPRVLAPWLENPAFPKVVHGAVSTYSDLEHLGLKLEGVIGDTSLASYLIDPTRHLPHRLEQVARAYLQRALQPLRGVVGSGRTFQRFDALSVDRCGAYACHLAEAIRALWPILADRLDEEGLREHHDQTDLPLAKVLARMEADGVAIDPAAIGVLGTRFEAERTTCRNTLHTLAGRSFNPGSPKQVGTVLFDELGLPVIKRTKTGYSTATEVLDQLRDAHPIIEVLERWRTLDKLISTYTEVLVHSVNPATGRIHCRFQQTASASGRLITTDPDLQRTPVRSDEFRDIRRGFVAPEGRRILSADWSQIELRILAHISKDPLLLEAFRNETDLHAQTAAALFAVKPAAVTSEQRSVGKSVNFATIYGQGAPALAQQLHVSHKEAKHYIDRFFQVYSGVKNWRDRIVTEAHIDGFVTTLGGRRRHIPELATGNWSDRSYGERIAMNTPIQGSAADLCKAAMLTIDAALRSRFPDTKFVLQIHDELLFEVPDADVEAVADMVREAMESAWVLEVPLGVDVGWGDSWATAH